MANNRRVQFDICIVCALAEEAEAAISVIEDEYRVAFEEARTRRGRKYKFAEVRKGRGKKVTIQVSWAADKGPVELVLHLFPILTEFKPRWVFMTGICAGDRREKVQLGDLVVASRTYFYDTGKFEKDTDGTEVYLPDIDTRHGDLPTVQALAVFSEWKKYVNKLDRPISKRQQRDWILRELLEQRSSSVDAISHTDLDRHVPGGRSRTSWRT